MNVDARGVVFSARLDLTGWTSNRVGTTIVYTRDGSSSETPVVSPIAGDESPAVPVGYIVGGIDGQMVGVYQGGIIPVQGADVIGDPIAIERGQRLTIFPPIAGSSSDSAAAIVRRAAVVSANAGFAGIEAIACTDIPERDPDGPVGYAIVNFAGSTVHAEATKITVPAVMPFSNTALGAVAVFSARVWIPPDVSTVRVRIGERQLFTPNGNATDTVNMKIAAGMPNATDTGFEVGYPIGLYTGITVPTFQLSEEYSFPVLRDANGFMRFAWTASALSYPEFVVNAGQFGANKTIAGGTDPTVTGAWVDNGAPCDQVLISYETTAPKVVVLGDSIARGAATVGQCGLLNTWSRMGPNNGYAVAVNAVSSTTAVVWANQSNWMLSDSTSYKDCDVIIALGTGDLVGGETAVNIILALRRLAMNARALGGKRLFMCTIPFSSTYLAPALASLALVNNWIKATPSGIVDGVIDVYGALGTNPAYLATGGVHLVTAAWDLIIPLALAQLER